MRNFDFHDFVGFLVPGVIFLAGVGALWPNMPISSFLLPTTTGAALINLVGAYAIGHLIQALGNLLEGLYWRLWGGMPTDWAVTRPARAVRTTAIDDAIKASRFKGKVADLRTWRQVFASARATIYDSGNSGRVAIFNGTYALFRGLTVCGLLFLATVGTSGPFPHWGYPILGGLTALALNRMHHFAVLYAREVHASIANVANVEVKHGD